MNDLKPGIYFIFQKDPYVVISAKHLKMGRSQPLLQVKIKNLLTGSILNQTFRPAETFPEAEIEKIRAVFLYQKKNQFCFGEKNNPRQRFFVAEKKLEKALPFLKPNLEVVLIFFNNQIIDIALPPKVDLKVNQAPPDIRGNTAQGGTKTVILETGAKVNVPFFVKRGDIIRVNTKTGKYIERKSKAGD